MANIGSLSVQLTAKTKPFQAGLRNATGSVRRFSGGIASITRSVGGFGTMLAGAAGVTVGVAGFGFALKKAVTEIDRVSKASQKIGVSAKEYSALELSAKRAGIGMSVMEKASQKMIQGVSDAAMGTGEAKDALEKLGLNAQKLNIRNPIDQLKAIAEAMEGVTNNNEKLAISMDLFGARGADMIRVLNAGSGALAQAQKDSERFGTAIGPEASKQIERTVDAIGDVREVLSGVFKQIAIRLGPAIELVSNKIVDFLAGTEGVPERVGAAMNMMARWVFKALNMLNKLYDYMQAFVAELQAWGAEIQSSLWGAFAKVGNNIYRIFATTWNKVNAAAYSAFAAIADGVAALIQKIAPLLNKIPGVNIDGSAVGNISKGLHAKAAAANAAAKAARTASPFGDGQWLKDYAAALKDISEEMWKGLVDPSWQGWGDKLEAKLREVMARAHERAVGDANIGQTVAKQMQGEFKEGKLQFLAIPGINARVAGTGDSIDRSILEEQKAQTQYLATIANNTDGASVAVAG